MINIGDSAFGYNPNLDVYFDGGFVSLGNAVFEHDACIHTSENLLLENYANTNSINLEITDADPDNISGDINKDGKITLDDMLLIKKAVLCDTDQVSDDLSADIDGNSVIDVFDYQKALRSLIKSYDKSDYSKVYVGGK